MLKLSVSYFVRGCAWLLPCVALTLVHCGGTPAPKTVVPTKTDEPTGNNGNDNSQGPSVSAEQGALDEQKVTKTFTKMANVFDKCQDSRRSADQKLDFLSGDVNIEVHVMYDGKVNAWLTHSTIGDWETEQCIIKAVQQASWPKPEGGKRGVAKTSFQLPQKGDRDAVAWDSSKVEKEVGAANDLFKKCQESGSPSALEVTAYVDTSGSVISVGASVPTTTKHSAVSCLVDAVKTLKFESPGGWPAKVTFTLP
jgi:hypothetical protein